MTILNIVFNVEIKYQQHAKLKKFIDRDFWSNFDPRKTHKGKTSERRSLLLFLRSEEMSFTAVNNIRNLIQNYLENCASFVFKMLI